MIIEFEFNDVITIIHVVDAPSITMTVELETNTTIII